MMVTRCVAALLLGLGLFSAPARAQEDTIVTFCLVPKIGTGALTDPYRPKYIADFLPSVDRSNIEYGDENTFLVAAILTQAQIDFLNAQGDAFVIPPLDSAVGGNPMLNRVRNYLENNAIPGSWIQATTTWRVAVGRIGRVARVVQRMRGITQSKLFSGTGRTLDTAVETLVTAFLEAAVTLGAQDNRILDTSTLTGTTTIREALLLIGDQLQPFNLYGEVF